MAIFMSSLMLFQIVGQAPAGGKPPEKITLERAVAEAREHNLELLAQRAQLLIADAQVITAGLRPNPTFNITADHLDALGTRFSALNGGGPRSWACGPAKRVRRRRCAQPSRAR